MKKEKSFKSRYKFTFKFISAFLAVLFVFQPTTAVFAEIGVDDDSSDNAQDAYIVSELEDLRDAYSKHFLMSNHTIQAVEYNQPVHYEENNEWKDYDLSLKYDANGMDNEISCYKAESPDYDVKFSENINSDTLVSISKDEYSLEWSMQEISRSRAFFSKTEVSSIENADELYKEDAAEINAVAKASDSIVYTGFDKGSDLKYQVNPNGIKESIVLNSKADHYEYKYKIKANGLEMKLDDAGNISCCAADDENSKAVFFIPHGVMFDSLGAYSADVDYILNELADGEYELIITADANWIEAEEREFPITIDPQVIVNEDKNIIICNLSSTKILSNLINDDMFLIGSAPTLDYGKCSALIKFRLPELVTGSTIISSKLALQENAVITKNDLEISTLICAYEVKTFWTDASSTSTKPIIDWSALDYDSISTKDRNTLNKGYSVLKIWDITKAVNDWYNGDDNHGIYLEGNSQIIGDNTICGSFFFDSEYGAQPLLSINYRSTRGIESYWTHTDMSNGERGLACVNDYSGNLTYFHTDVSTTGNRMPVEIQHVYNSSYAYKAGRVLPNVGKSWKMNIQQTVRISQIYGLSDEEAEHYPYVYEDGDGTTHFFYKKTEGSNVQYLDEDGLGLELTIRKNEEGKGNGFYIKDKNDNVMTFNINGTLIEYRDAQKEANTMSLTYENVKLGELDAELLKEITDGAGHKLTFISDSENNYMLTKMIDECGREYTYSYFNNELNRTLLPNNRMISFNYTTLSSKLEKVYDGETGMSLVFKYDGLLYGERIKLIEQYGNAKEDNLGQSISFNRKHLNQTTVAYCGLDGVLETKDDIQKVYQFDNTGRTVSVHSYNNYEDYGTAMYQYTASSSDTSAATLKQRNKVTSDASVGPTVNNLIKNIGAEFDGKWGVSTAVSQCTYTSSYTTATKYEGARSLAIHCTASNNDGRVRYYQDIDTSIITPGKTYTFSAYVKAAQIKQASASYGKFGAGLIVNATGADLQAQSDYISTSSISNDKGWIRLYTTFTVPENATSIRVNLVLRNATGYAYFDNMQLEESDTPSPVNLIENSSLTQASSTAYLPEQWKGSGLTLNQDNDGIHEDNNGNKEFIIRGSIGTNKLLMQDVYIDAEESDTYILSAKANANALSSTSAHTDADFNLSVRVFYSDGSSVYKPNIPFNKSVNEWQYTAGAFSLDDGTSAQKTPVRICVFLRYKNELGSAQFRDVQLVKGSSNSYVYDSEGNAVNVSKSANQSISNSYSGPDLTQTTNALGYTNEYRYDDSHNITSEVSQSNVFTFYKYNDSGSRISTEIDDSNLEYAILTETEYNKADEETGISADTYVTKTIDEDGYATLYDYDLLSGNLNSVTNSKGTQTNYTYDENTDRLKTVSSLGITETYSYSNNNISSLKRSATDDSDVEYSMKYNKFGNPTSTSVGNQVLSTNIYYVYNSGLARTVYGNDDYIKYVYNRAGNISEIQKNGEAANKYIYDNRGLLLLNNDVKNDLQYEYTYDTIGRVTSKTTRNPSTRERYSLVDYTYDTLNNVTQVRNLANHRYSTQTYSYGADNLITSHTFAANKEAKYNRDAFGRIKGIDYKYNNNVKVSTAYQYYDSKRFPSIQNIDLTTNKLKSEVLGSTGYLYEYDKLGNITKIQQGIKGADGTVISAVDKAEYYYDALSQLVRENNYDLNQTIFYTYNSGGNLLKKEIYALTDETEITSEPIDTITYAYENKNWKDQLTSYNGEAIEYDAIGNPTSYLGYTMNWFARELESLSGNGLDISYSYDENGMRLRKTVNGALTEYQYEGSKLIYEKRGEQEFYYTYDGLGNLSSITYYNNNAKQEYFVLCNSRGDVTELYTENGDLAAHYIYDSWGNTISVTDKNGNEITDENSIGLLNPIRYRGYYLDFETGYYYLQSRYYNPTVGRFLNADGYVFPNKNLIGLNLFAYCGNNPIMASDPTGYDFTWETFFDIFNVVVIMNEISTEMSELFGFDTANSYFTLLGGIFDLVPTLGKAFYNFLLAIPDTLSTESLVSLVSSTFLGSLVGKSMGATIVETLIYGVSSVIPLELAILVPSILADDRFSPSQKLTLAVLDIVSTVASYTLSTLFSFRIVNPTASFILQASCFMLPIVTDLVTRIVIRRN